MSGCRSLIIVAGVVFAGMAGLPSTEGAEEANTTATGKLVRTLWTTSRVVGSPEPPRPYRTVRMYEQLKIDQPVYAAVEPGTNGMFVIELQKGKDPAKIHRVNDSADVSTSQTLLSVDRLLYGLTFHPKYAENRYVYLITNGPTGQEHKYNRISRFTVPRDLSQPIDPASELIILEWESNGHNGGELGFGPDGYLYFASGDGTSDSDPLKTGQGVDDLLAVMLRLDVDHPTKERPYSIPPDNPFLDVPGARGEIWAFGFRNPWRMTFDRKTGHLWVTQNGQDLWEQVYLVRRGENYGWSVQEGSHPFYLERETGPGHITPPVAEHHHTEARSLTGGVVYYGSRLPELQGAYIYGDYSTGRIWGIRHDGTKVTWHEELVDTPFSIVGFVETPGGELAVIDQHSGLHRLEPAPPMEITTPFPQKLSETGLFRNVATHDMADGVIPYSVNAPLWSDGAMKDRYLALPGDTQIDFVPEKAWQFPEASVLVKTFSLEMKAGDPASVRRIETRLMTKQQNEWVGYTYAWNSEQTDAVLVERGGRDENFSIQDASIPGGQRTQTWHYPSRSECMVCHSRAAGFVLGPQTRQFNRVHDYATGPANQLEYLAELGVLKFPGTDKAKTEKEAVAIAKPALPQPAAKYGVFPDPADATQPLEQRVRAYLHVNCAVCHQMAGGGNSQMELVYGVELAKTRLVDETPYHDKFGITDARLVAPGAPDRSVLLQRMVKRGRGQMPPLASSMIDPTGTALLEEWIRSLPPGMPASATAPVNRN